MLLWLDYRWLGQDEKNWHEHLDYNRKGGKATIEENLRAARQLFQTIRANKKYIALEKYKWSNHKNSSNRHYRPYRDFSSAWSLLRFWYLPCKRTVRHSKSKFDSHSALSRLMLRLDCFPWAPKLYFYIEYYRMEKLWLGLR